MMRDPIGHMKTLLNTALIAAALAFGPAHASTEDEKPSSPQSEKSEQTQPKGEKKVMDTDSCRRDAKGLHGPERARFMTECLKKRD